MPASPPPGLRGRWCFALLATVLAWEAQAAEGYWPPIVDPPTHQFTPGRFVWGELVTADVGTAADFYGKVFGWTFETYGGTDDRRTYTLVLADGLPIGGMVFDMRARQGTTPSARWIGLISVPDVGATASAVTNAGGKVVLPPKVLGQRGETAIFSDPEGALFGAVNSSSGDPPDYAPDLNEWMWIDLWTNDVTRAAQFYTAVLGYDTVPVGAAGDLRQGVRLVASGYARGGIMQKQRKKDSTTWLPYVRVADAKAVAGRARAAGGKVPLEPVAYGKSLVGVIVDPTGAPVGIVQLEGVQP